MAESLPVRLREIADAITSPERATKPAEAEAALRGAADELERLALLAHPERTPAEPRMTYLGRVLDELVVPAGHAFAAIALPTDEALRLCGSRAPLPGVAVELDELGRELAGDAGVAAPMPRSRRFAASFRDAHAAGDEPRMFPTPAPGSFVFCGPALAVWRVLAVDELAGHSRGTHVLELEAVDVHDVPMLARVETVPMPVDELDVEGGGL